jgi:predicted nucleotidyltransferase
MAYSTTKANSMTAALRHIVDILAREIEPDRIILFGSRARGDDKEQSDYDICVLKTGVMHRRNLAKRIYRLLYDVDTPVDVIVETPQRFDELKANRFLIYKEIAKHGRIIYERQSSR